MDSSAILDFIETADRDIDSLNSFMFVRHGRVIAEGWWAPYEPEARHVLFSLSKSFTSTAVGLAVAEGKLSVDDEIVKLFPDDLPSDPHLKSMRVRDLLRMNTGHQTEPPRPADGSWKKAFLSHPVEFKPSTHFLYNTPATYMLAASVEKVTGMPLMDYLQPRLFGPLGITGATWDKSPEGITLGGYGLSVRTEDIARFGQLYLQRGRWEGKQILTEAWVAEATSFQTANGSNPKSDWDQGYGYQFWRCRNDAFRADGAFGQYCIVMPKQDAVIAITSGLGNMQAVMDLVWDKLLPAMNAAALPEDKPASAKLTQRLKTLTLPPQTGSTTPADVFGKKYRFPANDRGLESIALEKNENGSATLVIQNAGNTVRIACGQNTWIKQQVPWELRAQLLPGQRTQAIAASGAWSATDTFKAKLCLYETPFTQTFTLRFTGDELRFTAESNVAFGPTKDPELIGKL